MKPLFALLLLALFLSVGCTQHSDQQSNGLWTTRNSWYNPPPASFDYQKARELPKQEWSQVARDSWPKAQQMLQKTPIVPLSADQARGFTGKTFNAPKDTQPYLVRAVYLNAETGGFSVYESETALSVAHDCLGHQAVPMKRSALVVFLQRRPQSLSTEVSMAE